MIIGDYETEPYNTIIETNIEESNIHELARNLTQIVENTNSEEHDIVENGIHAPSGKIPKHWYSRRLTGWVHKHLLPDSFKIAVEKQYGVFVLIRETGEYHYEEMPLYTRIGMHLLFSGYYQEKVVESSVMHRLFLHETLRQGTFFTDPKSVAQIPSFVKHYNIAMEDYVKSNIADYSDFNDFFTRAIRLDLRPIAHPDNSDILVSAADARLGVFESVDRATEFWIKGKKFSIANLLQDNVLAEELEGGSVAIFRLAPQDYHRWHSSAHGSVESINTLQGTYYTVNPCVVNEDVNVFTENHRQVLTMKSPKGFRYAVVPIGALLVGSIVLTKAQQGQNLAKGDEMGYFQYGGSTVIMVFPKNTVAWDEDLLNASMGSLETKVTMGNRIGAYK
ncbi:phosphatidylserine decarboxylase-domain-containing protein [Spinellus fusiger]|nr:phosphatidylserine decarboxylase-domain-containing protein [Spinellus fusiger]